MAEEEQNGRTAWMRSRKPEETETLVRNRRRGQSNQIKQNPQPSASTATRQLRRPLSNIQDIGEQKEVSN